MENTRTIPKPKIEEHDGILVVRDDIVPGGTKRRVLQDMLTPDVEYVYASPVFGFAQIALAYSALYTGAYATVFCAGRKERHYRTLEAEQAGATIHEIRPGYLSTVQKRARDYATENGATLVPFGLDYPDFIIGLVAVAQEIKAEPKEVWCVAGSGVLTRALQARWPAAEHNAIRIGGLPDAGRAYLWTAPERFEQDARYPPPFPSCSNYDAKAWRFVKEHAKPGALFWNVAK